MLSQDSKISSPFVTVLRTESIILQIGNKLVTSNLARFAFTTISVTRWASSVTRWASWTAHSRCLYFGEEFAGGSTGIEIIRPPMKVQADLPVHQPMQFILSSHGRMAVTEGVLTHETAGHPKTSCVLAVAPPF